MSATGPAKVVSKKLIFKGSKPGSAPLKRKIGNEPTSSSSDPGLANAADHEKEEDEEEEPIEIKHGTGRLSTSANTVTGHYTKFQEELSVGDAIMVTHPTSLQQETKIVRMILSNVSMGISSSFSTDLISTTAFQYIKAPKDSSSGANDEGIKVKRPRDDEAEAYGTYGSKGGAEAVFRVKTNTAFGGYKIVKQSTGGGTTREELLEMRSKKKSGTALDADNYHRDIYSLI